MLTQQQTDTLNIIVGLFDAAPGKTFLDQFSSFLTAGGTTQALTNNLAASAEFQSLYSNSLSSAQFSENFLSTLLGNTVSAASQSWAENWMSGLLDQGASRGDAIYQAISALQNMPHSDATWGAAAQALNNKVAAAKVYSVDQQSSSFSLAELQAVVAEITQDSVISNSEQIIGTWFTKDVSADSFGTQTVTFNADGTYLSLDFESDLDAGNLNGTESGTYHWDVLTGELTTQATDDNNGNRGFNSPTLTLENPSIVTDDSGFQLTYTDDSFHFSAQDNTQAASPLVGNWYVEEQNNGINKVQVSFFADGTYAWYEDVAEAFAGEINKKVEAGVYSWDQQSGVLTSSTTMDANGELGINGENTTINIVGSSLQFAFANEADGFTFNSI